MTLKNPLLASNQARRAAAFSRYGNRVALQRSPEYAGTAIYPTVPSWWPSRVVRRAVKQGREFRLPQPWKQFLTVNPKLRAHILGL